MEDLLPRVKLVFDDSIPVDFEAMHIEIDIHLKDGRLLSKHLKELSGWVGNPLTREQRLRKYDTCVRRVVDPERAARVLELVEKLETLPDVREILDLLRPRAAA